VSINCVSCHHDIDDAAKVCPYCGSEPRTGEKVIDAEAMLHRMFKPREGRRGNLLELARQRQGAVVAGAVFIGLLILAGVYQFAVHRNITAAAGDAVPMTEVTDVVDQSDETKTLRMPELDFQYDGNPRAMRTYVVEPGAVAPPQPPQPAQPNVGAPASGARPGAAAPTH
jgi:hypothetical protein